VFFNYYTPKQISMQTYMARAYIYT